MPVPGPDVLVVGAGVSGLTTAVCLAEAGHGVEIRADRLPPDTTSAVAGALWGPHLVETGERAVRWCSATLAAFRELAAGPASGATGVRIAEGAQVFRGPPAPPDWLAELGGYRPCRPGRAAAGIRQRVAVRRAADSHADLSRLPAGQARARGRPDPRGHGGLAGRRGARGRGAGGRELLRGARPSARGRPGGDPGPGPDCRGRQPGPDRIRRRSRRRVRRARLPVPARRGDHPRRQRGGRGLEPRADPGGGRPDPARLRRDRAAAGRRPGAGAPGRPAPGPPDRAAGGRARRARRRPADRAQLRPRRGWRQPVLGLCARGRRPGRRAA